ncbi:hypothetical protein SDC9_76022 [bioreactor metagenome]|jgi:hypothetical protein|uniref:Uncharacterized protein n=1 Tax=bioreactor metagenome TaxID=1076179 RepID=A0A644YLH4_9ZZZZ|nr:hypothetical protein [Sphaerochaeta sp.]
MVMTTVASTQDACTGFAPSWSLRNIDGCRSFGAQVVYVSGDSIEQKKGNYIQQYFINNTAYMLSPHTYCFFSQGSSPDELMAPTAKQESVVTDIFEQFSDLNRFFQFRKTEWAHIFGVSRVTIYGWLNKSMEPSGENKRRIEQLYQMVCEVSDLSSKDTVQLYVHHHIAKLNASLFEVISSPQTIKNQRSTIIQVLEELQEKSRRKKHELDRLNAKKEASEATLAYNLDQLFS